MKEITAQDGALACHRRLVLAMCICLNTGPALGVKTINSTFALNAARKHDARS